MKLLNLFFIVFVLCSCSVVTRTTSIENPKPVDFSESGFSKLDSNKDGQISKSEYIAPEETTNLWGPIVSFSCIAVGILCSCIFLNRVLNNNE